MKTYCASALCIVLLAGFVVVNANGQASDAQAHVAAAKGCVIARGCECEPSRPMMLYSSWYAVSRGLAQSLPPWVLGSLTKSEIGSYAAR